LDSLEKIINGCRRRDLKYQKLLFDAYAGKMKYVCLRYLANDADAEDALQDGFIKLFSSIDQFENKGAFEGWMRRIFVTTALMAIRKKKARKEHVVEETPDSDIEPDELEDEGICASEINPDKIDLSVVRKADFSKEELLSCVSVLSEDFKIVFNLFYIENYRHADIAALLGIDENTSRTRLVRARKKIQAELYKRSIEKVMIQ
jgi:RNA polymerase sigma factor (sigma-70 family)